MLGILSAVFVIPAVYVLNFYRNVKRYPPGPTPLPLIGNMLQFPKVNIHKHIMTLREKYGPIFTIWLPHPTVVFLDFEDIKEALVKRGDDYIGRASAFPDTIFQPIPNGGIIFAVDEEWKEERRNAVMVTKRSLLATQRSLSTQFF